MATHWTNEDVEKARQLYYNGATFSEIAEQLSRTRNAIAGLCNRYQFKRAPKPPKIMVKKKILSAIVKKAKEIAEVIAPPPPPPPRNAPKSLIELESRDCRWPIGDNDFQFCAEEVVEGKPYCLKHCKLAYVPSRYAEKVNA